MNLLKPFAITVIGGMGIASTAYGTGWLIVYLIDPADRGLTPLYASAMILAGGFVFLASIGKLRQPLHLLVPLSIPIAFLVTLIPEALGYETCALNPLKSENPGTPLNRGTPY